MSSEHHEIHESYDIGTLRLLAQQRGHIPWANVQAWLRPSSVGGSIDITDLQKLVALTTRDRRFLADNDVGRLEAALNTGNPDVQALCYYMYALGAYDPAFFEVYFRGNFKENFEKQPTVQDFPRTVATKDQIIQAFLTFRNPHQPARTVQQARDQLVLNLISIKDASQHFNPPIVLRGSLLRIDDFMSNPDLLSDNPALLRGYPLVQVHDLNQNLVDFYTELDARRKTIADANAAATGKVTYPLDPALAVFFGIKAEHSAPGLGKPDDAATADAAKDYARFIIGTSYFDTNPGIDQTGITEITRRTFGHALEEFPLFKALAANADHITDHDIAHIVKDLDPKIVTQAIGHFRLQITEERKKYDGGITASQLPIARAFIRLLEEALAEKMAKIIREGDPAQMHARVRTVTYSLWRAPIKEVYENYHKVHHDLKAVPEPQKDPHSHHVDKATLLKMVFGVATKVFQVAGAIGQAQDAKEGLGIVAKALLGGGKPGEGHADAGNKPGEVKKDEPKGGHEPPPAH